MKNIANINTPINSKLKSVDTDHQNFFRCSPPDENLHLISNKVDKHNNNPIPLFVLFLLWPSLLFLSFS